MVLALRPTLIVVSGPPGSGKTTLAQEVSRAVPCPAICRDEIKEGMVHTQGVGFRGGPGDPLTQRTLPLFFEVVRLLLDGGVTVVAEAAFQDRLWRPGLAPLVETAELRIIRCKVDPSVSFERATARSALTHHVQAHGDSTLGRTFADWRQASESFEYIGLTSPSIDVDTTTGYEPSLNEILEFVNHA